MISENELRKTFLKKFLKLWREKSVLAKKGKPLEKSVRVPTRTFGIRKQLPKVVTDQTVEDFVAAFIKKEQEKGFIESNQGQFYIKHIPFMEIMLEIIDSKGKPTGLLEHPIVAIFAEAGFLPVGVREERIRRR